MKKRNILSLLLAFALCAGLFTVPALAAPSLGSGKTPIYLGEAEADYMAEEVLKQIPIQGKTGKEQIREVYDWIIRNCDRDEWDGTEYFDMNQVYTVVRESYAAQLQERINRGEVLIRPEYSNSNIYDRNSSVASSAKSIMRTHYGDCVDFSSFFILLVSHLGYDCRIIPGEFINRNGSRMIHKWNYMLMDGKYYWMDIRIDHANYTRTGKINHQYFMIDDTKKWASSHDWERNYSDWLAANVAQVVEDYNISAVAHSDRPWSRCSAWAGGYLDQAGQRGLIPDCLAGQDLSKNITRAEYCRLVVQTCEKLLGTTAEDLAAARNQGDSSNGNPFNGSFSQSGDGWTWSYSWSSSSGEVNFPSDEFDWYFDWPSGFGPSGGTWSPIFDNPFTDTNDTKLVAAYALGITSGTTDTTFSPDMPITREQGALMLHNAYTKVLEKQAPSANIDGFADSAQISGWARSGVACAYGLKAMNGYDDGRFGPQDGYTREQAIVALNNLYTQTAA